MRLKIMSLAANAKETAIMQALIDPGLDPSLTDENGNTWVMTAIMLNRPKVAMEMLNAGVGGAVDTVNNEGYTALYFARIYNSTKVVKLLIKMGAK